MDQNIEDRRFELEELTDVLEFQDDESWHGCPFGLEEDGCNCEWCKEARAEGLIE
jgi:hypothetical protein